MDAQHGRQQQALRRYLTDGKAAIQEQRAQHRLVGIGEQRGLVATAVRLFASPQAQRGAQIDLTCPLGQRGLTDHLRAQERQVAFAAVGTVTHQKLGDEQAQDRVAEKLQALVVRLITATAFVGVAAMGQRRQQEPTIGKAVPEMPL